MIFVQRDHSWSNTHVSTMLILLFILSAASVITADTALQCAKSEVVDTCPSCCESDFCPTADGQNETCEQPNPCPEPECKCRFNYRRAENGTCIPTRDCPPFPCLKPNEEYNPCPSYCPTDNCNQATPTGKCPLPGRILIVVKCNPTCRCIKGYWRNNGICVPYKDCPGVTQ